MSFPSKEILALANPYRVQILAKLETGPKSVGELAKGMAVSRPAVSQNLRVLEQARFVKEEFHGRRHVYQIDLTGMLVMRSWLDRFWDQSLSAFAAQFEQPPVANSTHEHSSRSSHR